MQQLLDTWNKSDDDVTAVDDMPAHQLDALSLSLHVRPEAGTAELVFPRATMEGYDVLQNTDVDHEIFYSHTAAAEHLTHVLPNPRAPPPLPPRPTTALHRLRALAQKELAEEEKDFFWDILWKETKRLLRSRTSFAATSNKLRHSRPISRIFL
jgi:hypothetical protein